MYKKKRNRQKCAKCRSRKQKDSSFKKWVLSLTKDIIKDILKAGILWLINKVLHNLLKILYIILN